MILFSFNEKKNIKRKFNHAIENAQQIIFDYQHISLDSLDHPIYRVIHIFAKAMQSRFLQHIITLPESELPHYSGNNLFHPDYLLLKKYNIPLKIYENSNCNNQVTIDFNKDIVFSFPWSFGRFLSILKLERGKWEYDKLNHKAYYYEPFKIGVVYNGFHSSSMGILLNQGTMPAQVIDLTSLYEWIYTDGIYYYNEKTKKKIEKVPSFEEAVIYEIGRLIHLNKI